MDETASGTCLCGTVEFRITGGFKYFFLCHCTRCRKDSGSAHSANLFSTSAKLEWLAGGEHVATFRLPDTRHVKAFCRRCGSALPVVQDGILSVPAGALDTELTLRPNAHICTSSRAGWDEKLHELPCIDGLPG
ncbi:GFA family protein [Gymnodinialimonas ceratoperidinii]|uniref:GFA family protein n=1 Tax=Gymnodinialimonas ceratoperidinii TaxID=2856823 RepID=A0A8F6TWY9_9RHOB|nr:GFA family protein [Gymnodinialimonas ceratoperidinii]QXT39958.1 GFA family protein [Gymnodinialimonas ceratoperidinii]